MSAARWKQKQEVSKSLKVESVSKTPGLIESANPERFSIAGTAATPAELTGTHPEEQSPVTSFPHKKLSFSAALSADTPGPSSPRTDQVNDPLASGVKVIKRKSAVASAATSATGAPGEDAIGGDQRLRVFLRVRPLSEDEQKKNPDGPVLEVQDKETVVLRPPPEAVAQSDVNEFKFDGVFGPDASYQKVYQGALKRTVQSALQKGTSGLLFCYGMTNAGKTFTVQGTDARPGLLPRALHHIFKGVGQLHSKQQQAEEDAAAAGEAVSAGSDAAGTTWSTEVSFLEVHNDRLFDLLSDPLDPSTGMPRPRAALTAKEGRDGRVHVRGLRSVVVPSLQRALEVMKQGGSNRAMAETMLNADSSRSHAVFIVSIYKHRAGTGGDAGEDESSEDSKLAAGKGRPKRGTRKPAVPTASTAHASPSVELWSRVCIVDLAGSERQARTKASGARLREAGRINTSLMHLMRCLEIMRHNAKALSSGQPAPKLQHVPFRASKLTRLLADFLARDDEDSKGRRVGGGDVTMVVNACPSAADYDETLHALKYAAVAREVKMGAAAAGQQDHRAHVKEQAAAADQYDEHGRRRGAARRKREEQAAKEKQRRAKAAAGNHKAAGRAGKGERRRGGGGGKGGVASSAVKGETDAADDTGTAHGQPASATQPRGSLAQGEAPEAGTPASRSMQSMPGSAATAASPAASVMGELAAVRAENEALLAALEESEERAAQLEAEVREEVSREMEQRIQEIQAEVRRGQEDAEKRAEDRLRRMLAVQQARTTGRAVRSRRRTASEAGEQMEEVEDDDTRRVSSADTASTRDLGDTTDDGEEEDDDDSVASLEEEDGHGDTGTVRASALKSAMRGAAMAEERRAARRSSMLSALSGTLAKVAADVADGLASASASTKKGRRHLHVPRRCTIGTQATLTPGRESDADTADLEGPEREVRELRRAVAECEAEMERMRRRWEDEVSEWQDKLEQAHFEAAELEQLRATAETRAEQLEQQLLGGPAITGARAQGKGTPVGQSTGFARAAMVHTAGAALQGGRPGVMGTLHNYLGPRAAGMTGMQTVAMALSSSLGHGQVPVGSGASARYGTQTPRAGSPAGASVATGRSAVVVNSTVFGSPAAAMAVLRGEGVEVDSPDQQEEEHEHEQNCDDAASQDAGEDGGDEVSVSDQATVEATDEDGAPSGAEQDLASAAAAPADDAEADSEEDAGSEDDASETELDSRSEAGSCIGADQDAMNSESAAGAAASASPAGSEGGESGVEEEGRNDGGEPEGAGEQDDSSGSEDEDEDGEAYEEEEDDEEAYEDEEASDASPRKQQVAVPTRPARAARRARKPTYADRPRPKGRGRAGAGAGVRGTGLAMPDSESDEEEEGEEEDMTQPAGRGRGKGKGFRQRAAGVLQRHAEEDAEEQDQEGFVDGQLDESDAGAGQEDDADEEREDDSGDEEEEEEEEDYEEEDSDVEIVENGADSDAMDRKPLAEVRGGRPAGAAAEGKPAVAQAGGAAGPTPIAARVRRRRR